MGKRSNYELKPRDKYYTPLEAVKPLVDQIVADTENSIFYYEPCAGNGALVRHLETLAPNMICLGQTDIEPDEPHYVTNYVTQKDALDLTEEDLAGIEVIITNPPFTWSILKPMMEHFISLRPTILLLPADFIHNKRMAPFMDDCAIIISIGRVKWIVDSKATGVDNYIWAIFDKNRNKEEPTIFIGRT